MSLYRRPIRRIALAAKTSSFINKPTLRSFSQQNIYTQLEQTYFVSQSKRSFIFTCVIYNDLDRIRIDQSMCYV